MKLKILITSILLWQFLDTHAQTNPVGKTFIAEIYVACKEGNTGSCTLFGYCVLNFEKDSVTVSYSQKAACSAKEIEMNYTRDNQSSRVFSWDLKNSQVRINGFLDYGVLLLKDNTLVGKIQKNKLEDLVFISKDK